jgi:hypothetical protein
MFLRSSIRRTSVAACILVLAELTAMADSSCDSAFVRGDADGDGHTNISDSVALLVRLFSSGTELACDDAADSNDDGRVDISDAALLLGHLFLGAPSPGAPFGACGRDPTPDGLGCIRFTPCPFDPPPEICDGLDNDCDDEIDEDFDLLESVDHCGRCRNACAENDWPHVARYECHFGVCLIVECTPHRYDIDGIAENGCEIFLPPDGTPCNDGKPCTDQDQYFAGVCGGTPRDCSSLDSPCSSGRCDVETGECVQVPLPAGTPCDDADPDTSNERCNGRGECVTIPILHD